MSRFSADKVIDTIFVDVAGRPQCTVPLDLLFGFCRVDPRSAATAVNLDRLLTITAACSHLGYGPGATTHIRWLQHLRLRR